MRRGTTSSMAQTIARAWVLAAVASLFLPPADRLGWWLPIHLALAGAAATAIAGAAPDFAAAISAGRVPRWAWVPVVLFSLGAGAIGLGVPGGRDPLIAAGGVSFLAGSLTLAAAVRWSWRSGINRRHRPIATLYGFAALCPAVGATIGALMATGTIGSAATYVDLRRAHVAVNLAGFLALTIVATSVLLVPTVLRVRAPRGRTATAFTACACGIVLATAGLATGARVVAGLGTVSYLAGCLVVLAQALNAASPWPKHAERAASLHLLCGLAWLTMGSILWSASVIATSDRVLGSVIVIVALGTVVQSLLGAWSHLIPMSRPGGPDVHRALLARADVGARSQVAAFNAGVAMTAAASVGAPTMATGITLVVGAALFAMAKTSVRFRGRTEPRPGSNAPTVSDPR